MTDKWKIVQKVQSRILLILNDILEEKVESMYDNYSAEEIAKIVLISYDCEGGEPIKDLPFKPSNK